MIERRNFDEDRKRALAFEALAHPVSEGELEATEENQPSLIEFHDGEEFDDSPPEEDILEGLDRQGLDPRTERRSI